jgi:hypothetical protein
MKLVAKSGKQWQELRRRELLVFFAFFGYIPFAVGLAILVSQFTQQDAAIFAAPLLWMVFFLVSCLRFAFWPCPECGKPFHAKWGASFNRGLKCVHCGTSRYE